MYMFAPHAVHSSPSSKSFSASSTGKQRKDDVEYTDSNIWTGQQVKMYQQKLASHMDMKPNYIIHN